MINYRITPALRKRFTPLGAFGTEGRLVTLGKMLEQQTDVSFLIKPAVIGKALRMLEAHENVATVRGHYVGGYIEFFVSNVPPKKIGNWLMLCS